ncbi:hypothetical protein Tco_0151085 [Tanacetum coccineum]
MSNTNTNLQTQTSNALHNAIMEAGGKDRPPMLAPGNYIQWKSRIKRYIDTKPNNELIHYCLQNPPYKFKWTKKTILVTKGSSETTIEGYMENYKIMSQDIRNQLDTEAEVEFVKFTSRDGESLESYYSRFYKMMNELGQELKTVSYHKLYDILKQHQNEVNEIRAERLAPRIRNRGKAIVTYPLPTYDQATTMVAEDDKMSKEKEIDKLMALISLSFKKIYKPTNNHLKTSSNTSRENQDNTPRIHRGTRHVARECQKPKRAKDATYHKEKMLLCKQEEAGFQLNIQEVTPDAADNSRPIFDTKPLQKVQNDDDNYNVFANDREHLEQPESVNDTYLEEQGDTNITTDSLDMSTNGEMVDQDDDDLARERDLLASLIDKLKCEIDDNKKYYYDFGIIKQDFS